MIAVRRNGRPLIGLCDGQHSYFMTELQLMKLPNIIEQSNILFCTAKHDEIINDCSFIHHQLDFLSTDESVFELHLFLYFLQIATSVLEQEISISQYALIDFMQWKTLLDFFGSGEELLLKLEDFATQTKWEHPMTTFHVFRVYKDSTKYVPPDVDIVKDLDAPSKHLDEFYAFKVAAHCGLQNINQTVPLSNLDRLCIPHQLYPLLKDFNKTALISGPACALLSENLQLLLPCHAINIYVYGKKRFHKFAIILQSLGYVFARSRNGMPFPDMIEIMAVAPTNTIMQLRNICFSILPYMKSYKRLRARLHCDKAIAYVEWTEQDLIIKASYFSKLAWRQRKCHFGKTDASQELIERYLAEMSVDAEQISRIVADELAFPPDSQCVNATYFTHQTVDKYVCKNYSMYDIDKETTTLSSKRKRGV